MSLFVTPAAPSHRPPAASTLPADVTVPYCSVGASADPRLVITAHKIDFFLNHTMAAIRKKEDPPPNRAKPIPVRAIRRFLTCPNSLYMTARNRGGIFNSVQNKISRWLSFKQAVKPAFVVSLL